MARGQRVEIIQRVLGHRDIRSTLGYAELPSGSGARPTGALCTDLSRALLDRARACATDEPLPISYVHGDTASRSLLDGEVFDAVVCSFGLSDIDDISVVAGCQNSSAARAGGALSS